MKLERVGLKWLLNQRLRNSERHQNKARRGTKETKLYFETVKFIKSRTLTKPETKKE